MIAQVARMVNDNQEAEVILSEWRRCSNFLSGYIVQDPHGNRLIALFSCGLPSILRNIDMNRKRILRNRRSSH